MPLSSPEDVRNGRKAKLTSSSEGGLFEAAQRFWRKSHASDYVGLALVVTAILVIHAVVEPFHQMFMLSDVRLQHPWAEAQRVDVFYLFLYSLGIPLITILLYTLALHRNPHKAHTTTLGLITSILLTTLITDILKNAIGRPRPDLIARCQPSLSAPRHDYITLDQCTETEHHKLHDGFRSFPSGHSSFAFAGLGYLALFLVAQTQVLRPRASLVAVLLCLSPLVGAGLVAISRLEDYRHDVFDVVAGSVLGMGVAYGNWRRYYPSLFSKYCDEPYSRPSSGRTSPRNGYERAGGRDEEEGIGMGVEDERFYLGGEEGNGGGGGYSGGR